MIPFDPLVRNPHVLTILGNFAMRRLDEVHHPVQARLFETGADAKVLVHVQRPEGPPRGELLMIHGLEGSSSAGYMRSAAQLALEAGFGVHRSNLRSCGGTESLCKTMYHAGLTADTLAILREMRNEGLGPIFLIGFSLGGNVALKLAGELGDSASQIISGVAGLSTPIDLGACVRKMSELQNRIYEWRFLSRLKQRIQDRSKSLPGVYDLDLLAKVRSVYEFDDRITAPSFGFGTADRYYETQSSQHFLERIRVPALLVQAKDDPLIPFDIFSHPAIRSNSCIQMLAVEHGGHLGFIARRAPRFWLDRVIINWISSQY